MSVKELWQHHSRWKYSQVTVLKSRCFPSCSYNNQGNAFLLFLGDTFSAPLIDTVPRSMAVRRRLPCAPLASLTLRPASEDGGGCRCRLSPVAHNYSRSLPVTCDIWYFRRKNTTSAKNRRKIDVWQERKLTFNSLSCLFRFIFLLTGSNISDKWSFPSQPPQMPSISTFLLFFFYSGVGGSKLRSNFSRDIKCKRIMCGWLVINGNKFPEKIKRVEWKYTLDNSQWHFLKLEKCNEWFLRRTAFVVLLQSS